MREHKEVQSEEYSRSDQKEEEEDRDYLILFSYCFLTGGVKLHAARNLPRSLRRERKSAGEVRTTKKAYPSPPSFFVSKWSVLVIYATNLKYYIWMDVKFFASD